MALLAFAAVGRAAASLLLGALDRHLVPAGRSAANPPHAQRLSNDGADGRTPDRSLEKSFRGEYPYFCRYLNFL